MHLCNYEKWNKACKQTLTVALLFIILAAGEVTCCCNYEKWNTAYCEFFNQQQVRDKLVFTGRELDSKGVQ